MRNRVNRRTRCMARATLSRRTRPWGFWSTVTNWSSLQRPAEAGAQQVLADEDVEDRGRRHVDDRAGGEQAPVDLVVFAEGAEEPDRQGVEVLALEHHQGSEEVAPDTHERQHGRGAQTGS